MKTKLYHLVVLFLLVFGNDVKAQAPSWAWAHNTSSVTTKYNTGTNIAIDGSGNIYTVGMFQNDSITFGSITLFNPFSLGLYWYEDIFIVKYDANGNVLWARSAGGNNRDYVWGIAIDNMGNAYITGNFFSQTITFGATTLTNSGACDIFIAKYDTNGNLVWVKKEGGAMEDVANGIATDKFGNFYLTGSFESTITIGTTTLTNSGDEDFFMAKYDTAGNAIWAKSTIGISEEIGTSIATDDSGNVFVAGNFLGQSIIFGTVTLTTTSNCDLFIIKCDSDGNVLWYKNTGQAYPRSIAVDDSGNVLLTGNYLNFPIVFGTITTNYFGSGDIFIVKYDSGGNVLWAKGAGGTSDDFGFGITTDNQGNAYITGYFDSPSCVFDSITVAKNSSYEALFIATYSAAGNLLWVKNVGGPVGYGITNDGLGNSYVTGHFMGPSVTFGTITLISPYDFFVAKLDYSWTSGIPSNETENIPNSIYPNPTTNLLHLSPTKPLPPNTTITVSDIQGRVVKEKMLITPRGDVDVSTLMQGVYLLKVNGQVQRFVKM